MPAEKGVEECVAPVMRAEKGVEECVAPVMPAKAGIQNRLLDSGSSPE